MAFEPPVDLTKLPAPVQRLVAATAAAPMLALAARGAAPGLRPEQTVIVVALLSRGDLAHVDAAARDTAEATLGALPAPTLAAALAAPDLPPGIIDVLATIYALDLKTVERIVVHSAVAPATIEHLAAHGSEAVTELIALNDQRLLDHPEIIVALYMNKHTRMSTADRVLELAVRNGKTLAIPAFQEAAAAIKNEIIEAPSPKATAADLLFNQVQAHAEGIDEPYRGVPIDLLADENSAESLDESALSLEQQIRLMSISQKIRTAILGSTAARAILIREQNRIVAVAAARSPLIQENEAAMYAASRSVCEDVLRIIGNNKDFTKSHVVKVNLVANPKTPLGIALKMMPFLRLEDLKRLSKSKNVSMQVARLARQEIEKKGPKR